MRRLVVISILGAFWAAAAPAAMNFGLDDPLTISGGTLANQSAPDIVADGDLVHMVFLDDRTSNQEIWYARLGQFGAVSYESEFDTTSPATELVRPRIAIDPIDGQLYVAYIAPNAYPYHVYVRRSDDGGENWSGPIQVTDTDGLRTYPDLTVLPSGRVVVTWTDADDSSDAFIVVDFSDNDGLSWGADNPVPTTYGALDNDIAPAIASDDAGDAYLVWTKDIATDRRIFFSHSSTEGSTWDTPNQLNASAAPPFDDDQPAVTAWGAGHVVVVFSSDSLSHAQADILTLGSINAGATWLGPMPVYQVPNEWNLFPQITHGSGETVFVAWDNENAAADRHIGVARFPVYMTAGDLEVASVDGGPDTGAYPFPSIAGSSTGRVTVVWSDERGGGYRHLFADKTEPSFHDNFEDPLFGGWELHDGVQLDFGLSYDLGGSSARMGTLVRAPGLLEQVWPAEQVGSVAFWFYDGYPAAAYLDPASGNWRASLEYDDGGRRAGAVEDNGGAEAVEDNGGAGAVEDNGGAGAVEDNGGAGAAEDGGRAGVVRTLGAVNPSSTTHYSTSTNGGASWQVSSVPRSTGWHSVEFEVSGAGLTAEIDAHLYPSANPVMTDTSFTQFDTLTFAGGSFSAPYNVDELNCETLDASFLVPALSSAGLVLLAGAVGWLVARRRRS